MEFPVAPLNAKRSPRKSRSHANLDHAKHMSHQLRELPQGIWALFAFYFMASLAHFAHNAEYIAFYPNMPASLTRETVYLAWLAITGVGALGVVLARFGLRTLAAILIAAYGAFGLDGLAHYTLALCSEHTLATNVTIWLEVVTGASLLLASAIQASRFARVALHARMAPNAHTALRNA